MENDLQLIIDELISKYGHASVAQAMATNQALLVDPPKCPAGYVWDSVLKTCVFDG